LAFQTSAMAAGPRSFDQLVLAEQSRRQDLRPAYHAEQRSGGRSSVVATGRVGQPKKRRWIAGTERCREDAGEVAMPPS